jgi:two-component system, cell cycle response regulator DivK
MHLLPSAGIAEQFIRHAEIPRQRPFRRICFVRFTCVVAGSRSMQEEAAPKTILIVEDNVLNMMLFHDLLQMCGYNILQAKDGIEALNLTRQHHPDLIVMDIQLPGMSGIEVTKWIKEDDLLKAIPIIAVTALALKGDQQKIREAGCDGYIAKPMSTSYFLKTIEQFLRQHDK